MKTSLLTQISLSAIFALSLSACQKSNNSSDGNGPAAPTEVTKEQEPSQKMTREEALAGLESVGLRFAQPLTLAETELHEVTARWDLRFYRAFLKSDATKPSYEAQIEALKTFISVSESSLQDQLDSMPQELENESTEDLQKLYERALLQSQVGLAQARVSHLEKKIAKAQSQDSDEQGDLDTPVEEPKLKVLN